MNDIDRCDAARCGGWREGWLMMGGEKQQKAKYPIWYPIMNTQVFLQNIIRCCSCKQKQANEHLFTKPIIFDDDGGEELEENKKKKNNKTRRPKL